MIVEATGLQWRCADAAGQQNHRGLPVDLFDGQSSSQGGWAMADVA